MNHYKTQLIGMRWAILRAEILGQEWAWDMVCTEIARKGFVRVCCASTGIYSGAAALGRLAERIGGANG